MFVTIRRYTPKGAIPENGMQQLGRQIQEEFVPLAREIPGFHGYYCVNVRDRELVTLSIFETREGAVQSTQRAAQYVRENKLPFDINPPEVLEGEVLAAAEAGREAGVR
jgi:hypothetical protein